MDSWALSKKPLLTLEGTCFAILATAQGEMMWNVVPVSHVTYLRVSLIRNFVVVVFTPYTAGSVVWVLLHV